jgi:hypothetical protein
MRLLHIERLIGWMLRRCCSRGNGRSAYPRERAYRSTWGHGDLDVLGTTGDHAFGKIGDLDAFGDVVVTRGDNLNPSQQAEISQKRSIIAHLDDLVTRKFELRNICRIACHQIPIKHA